MQQPTTKIEIGDGHFIVLVKPLMHRTAVEIHKYLEQFQDKKTADEHVVGEIFIRNQGVEWSFGDLTTDNILSVFAGMTEAQYQKLSSEVDRLYSQTPLAVKPAGFWQRIRSKLS